MTSDRKNATATFKGVCELKKKQRCLLKRFAALVAALMLCASLSVPCFASNNAQWGKWRVVGEQMMTNESGTQSRYLHLSPYVDGNFYRTRVTSYMSYRDYSQAGNAFRGKFLVPVNFPAWIRSSIPLGGVSYLQIDSWEKISGSASAYTLYIADYRYAPTLSASGFYAQLGEGGSEYLIDGVTINSSYPFFPVSLKGVGSSGSLGFNSDGTAAGVRLPSSTPVTINIQDSFSQVILRPYSVNGWAWYSVSLSNLTSDNLMFLIGWTGTPSSSWDYADFWINLSFWVDANKLPSGLEVGDEFPADTDAFDQLRDDLIDQFPEAADNIENGKSTLTGWNDTETVDSDVASTSISALNAMFQNLGSFLFVISLMVFGAVVLRMFIRKAVDG